MQALYSDQHRYLDDGYGVKYETAADPAAPAVAFLPWRGGREHRELMQALPHTLAIGVLLRDRDGGEVRVGRDGQPVVRYRLSDYDLGHLRAGIDGAAQILEAAGAQRIFSCHSRWVAYEPGRDGDRRAVHGATPTLRLRARPVHAGLVPHHGLGAHGRLARELGLRPERARPGTCATSMCATARPSRRPQASTR